MKRETGRMGESMDRCQDESTYLICWFYFLTDIKALSYSQGRAVACVFIYGMMEYSVGKQKEAQTLNQKTLASSLSTPFGSCRPRLP